MIVTKILV